MGKLERK